MGLTMTGQVIVIPAEGSQPIRTRETDTPPTLQELQDIVDGHIEPVPHWSNWQGQPCVVWCNEDGKRDNLPVNVRATVAWAESLHISPADLARQDVLVGDIVLVVNLPDEEEEE